MQLLLPILLAATTVHAGEGSCVGKCGSLNAVKAGSVANADLEVCFCDDTCVEGGDCCDNYISVCGDVSPHPTTNNNDDDDTDVGGTCSGQCGSLSPVFQPGGRPSCFCHPSCVAGNDCCDDFQFSCKGKMILR